MALIACGECGREISDKAAACPHCGAPMKAPVAPAAPGPHRNFGCGTLLLVGVAVLMLYACWPASRPPGDGVDNLPPPHAPKAQVSAELQRETLERFKDMPGVRHSEWLDGDFIIAAIDNGKTWQPVAESTCAWIRRRGAPEGFAVVVLEAGALQNKRWNQLARARCN